MSQPNWKIAPWVIVPRSAELDDFEAELRTIQQADYTPKRKTPDLPLEVFNETPIDPERAMSVTRSMCGGGSR